MFFQTGIDVPRKKERKVREFDAIMETTQALNTKTNKRKNEFKGLAGHAPLACNNDGGDRTIADARRGGNVLLLSRGAPLPMQSSDLSHVVDDDKVRVTMITTVSPLPTRWACSLSVLRIRN